MTTTLIVALIVFSLSFIGIITTKIYSRETPLAEFIYLYLHNRKVWYDYNNVRNLITKYPNENFPVYSTSYVALYDLLDNTLKNRYWICITDDDVALYFGDEILLINSPLVEYLLTNKLHYPGEFIYKVICVEKDCLLQCNDWDEWTKFILQTNRKLTFTEYISTYHQKYLQPTFTVRI